MPELHEVIDSYVGGQLAVRNYMKNSLYRGEIETIAIEDGELRIKLAWNAFAKGNPFEKWVQCHTLGYEADLDLYDVEVRDDNGWVMLNSKNRSELSVLLPKGNIVLLHPSQVEGLREKLVCKEE